MKKMPELKRTILFQHTIILIINIINILTNSRKSLIPPPARAVLRRLRELGLQNKLFRRPNHYSWHKPLDFSNACVSP
jgi:hypothetical protein